MSFWNSKRWQQNQKTNFKKLFYPKFDGHSELKTQILYNKTTFDVFYGKNYKKQSRKFPMFLNLKEL